MNRQTEGVKIMTDVVKEICVKIAEFLESQVEINKTLANKFILLENDLMELEHGFLEYRKYVEKRFDAIVRKIAVKLDVNERDIDY
tara:strand:- start:1896 stop:2153 length:258 start_codon:yes stop_codon:yes gene_type:complete